MTIQPVNSRDVNIADLHQFKANDLNKLQLEYVKTLSRNVRKDILEMTTKAGTGHLGGALSSADIYIMLWLCANVKPFKVDSDDRDRIVVSHGHTVAAVYAVLGNLGFFDRNEALSGFRRLKSIYEGHPNPRVPGIEWGSGILGQGLSVGCGFALAAKIKKLNYHTFVVMGDGEQQKGQITEAGALAVKFGMKNLTAIIDCNGVQASGQTEEVMPQDILKKYTAAGWRVIEIDGHDHKQIYQVLKSVYFTEGDVPTMILAHTILVKGVSSLEGKTDYHGKPLTVEQYEQAIKALDFQEDHRVISFTNGNFDTQKLCQNVVPVEDRVIYGTPITYSSKKEVDCRFAFGQALYDIVANNIKQAKVPIAIIDCDLAESVKVKNIREDFGDSFIECGIQEHNAATIAGALSKSGVLTFIVDFAVFGIDETYSQHRVNDFNRTSLKLICTHSGLDVGEDGKTHQCIDYVSLLSNLFGYKLIISADANQTDRIIRYVTMTQGNFAVVMGRSKIPILTDDNDKLIYGEGYKFEYGKSDWIRTGKDGTIITCGGMVFRALEAQRQLKESGIEIGVLNISCPGALDISNIKKASETGLIVTYEDHHISTGIGSIIGAFLAERGFNCRFRRMGVKEYGVSADADNQFYVQRLDSGSLVDLIENELK